VADLVTVTAAIEHFGISRATVFRTMAAGELTRYWRCGSTATMIERRQFERQLRPHPEKGGRDE
jgi:hypothetical protein